MKKVILVDRNDKEIGSEFKIKAHKEGKLHRAFSIFVFNNDEELLIQKRCVKKYHSGGLWTNTCCSHPMPGEGTTAAAHRRLKEEMGFDCPLSEIFSFVYKVKFDNSLIENEFDHVFLGYFNDEPKVNQKEVEDYRWISQKNFLKELGKNPESYTYWLRKCYKRVLKVKSL